MAGGGGGGGRGPGMAAIFGPGRPFILPRTVRRDRFSRGIIHDVTDTLANPIRPQINFASGFDPSPGKQSVFGASVLPTSCQDDVIFLNTSRTL